MKSNNVGDIVRQFRNEGKVASINQKGRTIKFTTREERGILRKVKTKPRLNHFLPAKKFLIFLFKGSYLLTY